MQDQGLRCALCGCAVHRDGDYAEPTIKGRSHATRHHYVAERFFGRSGNRPREQRERVFATCPWNSEGKTELFCYECHEEILHNPVFLPQDIAALASIILQRGLNEDNKTEDRSKLAGRTELMHEVIQAGLKVLSRPPSSCSFCEAA